MRTDERPIDELDRIVGPILSSLGFERASHCAYKLRDDELLFRNEGGLYLGFNYEARDGWLAIGMGRVLDLDEHVQLSGTYKHFLTYFRIEPAVDYDSIMIGYRGGHTEPGVTFASRVSQVVVLLQETLPQILSNCTPEDVCRIEQHPPRLG